MKKSIRALFLAAFMFLTLFTMPAFAYDISATQDALTIENGVFTNESARPIQDAIDQYINACFMRPATGRVRGSTCKGR